MDYRSEMRFVSCKHYTNHFVYPDVSKMLYSRMYMVTNLTVRNLILGRLKTEHFDTTTSFHGTNLLL